MPLISQVADYISAIKLASGNSWRKAPLATMSVVNARIRFNIGPRYHSLFRLSSTPTSDWNEYLLDVRTNPELRRMNAKHHRLARNKLAFAEHCAKNGLPTIPIICIIGREIKTHQSVIPYIRSSDDWIELLGNAPEKLFFKLINGAHGTDAFSAHWFDGKWTYQNQIGSTGDLYHFCIERLGARNGWIVQPEIAPHPSLAKIMPNGALGTIRAVTYLRNGQPKLLLPLLRIPAGDNHTDNFSGSASGNLVAPIELESGELGAAHMSRSRSWPEMVTMETHPNTGHAILGRRIPYWDDARNLMLMGQVRTPQLRTIGWDIAITSNGPIIVEANTAYDVNLLQVAYNRGLKMDLEPVLSLGCN